jgi:asparagine synthase (glutamine-hydrolysing)
MCGIAGLISNDGTAACSSQLDRMMWSIRHRGPDGSGKHVSAFRGKKQVVGLGHLRLAIIDVVAGLQPMSSKDTRYTVVFNGEIYNYIEIREELVAKGYYFETHSDTEVLLAAYIAWGEACLSKFRGMFAFAIWDKKLERLFLARDPFGKKPLYYMQNGPRFVFASELAALAQHPDFKVNVDRTAVAQYLLFKYVPSPDTMLANVKQVPPGNYAVWERNELTIKRFFERPVPNHQTYSNPKKATEAFLDVLTESVRLRLRSDVPVGAFLSGGLDSSAVVALMSRETGQQVKTYSVGFEDEKYSELSSARIVAKEFKTDHKEVVVGPEDFVAKFNDVTWLRGSPLTEMADIPLHLMCNLAAKDVKVVLSGEGADELMGGYPKHWAEVYAESYHRFVPGSLDQLLIGVPANFLSYKHRKLAILLRSVRERNFLQRQAGWFGAFDLNEAAALAPGLFDGIDPSAMFTWTDDIGDKYSSLRRSLYYDMHVWLPSTLLERGDRMTMGSSIEGRMPFMDVKLAEFVAGLPDKSLVQGRVGKSILRQAMSTVLPEHILTRPKVGFRVPVGDWFRGHLRPYVHDYLLSPGSKVHDYIDASQLRVLVNQHMSGQENRENQIWSILALEIYLRQLSERSGTVEQSIKAA